MGQIRVWWDGVSHAGVGWVMQRWGGMGHVEVGWVIQGLGGSYRGWVGHAGWGRVGLNVNFFPIHIQPFMNDSN